MSFRNHIAILAFPFGTHAAPLLALVQRLAASAPDTKFSFFNTSVSNSSLFSARVSNLYVNIQAYDVWDGTPEGETFTGSHFEAIDLFVKASPRNFEKVIEEAEKEAGLRISCLISDAFLWFACDMAEKRGVPWVAFWTAASCSLSAHLYTDEIQKAVGLTEIVETVSFIPGMTKVQLNELPAEIFLDKHPTPLARTVYNMVQKLSHSTIIVLNSFEEIDPTIANDLKSKFRHFLNVGPSILSSPTLPIPDDQHGCLSWLEKQTRPESVIYISFGTVIGLPENELVALAEALEVHKLPFLWTMKDHMKKVLPEGFSERTGGFGKIVPWAPQVHVLQHVSVGLFVTHCGWNSILESICGGVPMICRPFFGDQKLNGRMVESVWKIGVRVEGGVFSKDDMIKAIDYVSSGEDGREIRENVYRLRDEAMKAVELEGSSSRNFGTLLEIVSTS